MFIEMMSEMFRDADYDEVRRDLLVCRNVMAWQQDENHHDLAGIHIVQSNNTMISQ